MELSHIPCHIDQDLAVCVHILQDCTEYICWALWNYMSSSRFIWSKRKILKSLFWAMMSGFVLCLLYSFIAPCSCRPVQQKSVHIEWIYAYMGTWSQHHISKIYELIAILDRFLSMCLIANSELQSLSQVVWHWQPRLLFLAYSLISPVLWDLVGFCSPFQQHETSLCCTKLFCYCTSAAAFVIRPCMVMIRH